MAEPRHWDQLTKTLHWITAAVTLAMLAGGAVLWLTPEDQRGPLAAIHASAGLVALFLALVWSAWRAVRRRPPHPQSAPAWTGRAAPIAHGLLLLLLLHQGVVGVWMGALARPDVWVFAAFNLGALGPDNPALHAALKRQHLLGGAALGGLVLVHALGALAHLYLWRDGVMGRMAPLYSVVLKARDERAHAARGFPSSVKGFDWKRWKRA
jgi:cytochrome b561